MRNLSLAVQKFDWNEHYRRWLKTNFIYIDSVQTLIHGARSRQLIKLIRTHYQLSDNIQAFILLE